MNIKKLIILCFILHLTIGIFAQPYSNYINYTSSWGMRSAGADGLGDYISNYKYTITGDTTIGGIDYFKLFRTGIDSIIPRNGTPSANLDYRYAGALRETASKRFYILYTGRLIEQLLFDFNINIGSTLQDTYSNYGCNNPPLVVQTIDTLYLGAIPRKRFLLNNQVIQGIIEGIGSGGGIIEQGGMCFFYEFASYLACYRKDNDVLAVNSFVPCELISVSCSAQFNLVPDTVPHRYNVINRASGASPLSYIWEWGDGNYDTIPFPSHTYDTAGYYRICLRITDSLGCSDVYCNSHNLLKTSNAIVEVNVIPPPTTGVKTPEHELVLIFPNPASDYLTIMMQSASKTSIRIFNIQGELELKSKIFTPIDNIDISMLPAGLYILELTTDNNIRKHKFIKQ